MLKNCWWGMYDWWYFAHNSSLMENLYCFNVITSKQIATDFCTYIATKLSCHVQNYGSISYGSIFMKIWLRTIWIIPPIWIAMVKSLVWCVLWSPHLDRHRCEASGGRDCCPESNASMLFENMGLLNVVSFKNIFNMFSVVKILL